MAAPTTVTAVFAAGPLGLALSHSNALVNVAPGGQAESQGLKPGDTLSLVEGRPVKGLAHEDVLAAIKGCGRPMTLVFVRADAAEAPAAAAVAAEGGAGGAPAKLADTVKAAQAVKRAGSLMKGFLGAGVQVVKAFDRALDKAIDDSARQAKVSTRSAKGGTDSIRPPPPFSHLPTPFLVRRSKLPTRPSATAPVASGPARSP
jgi:hypothetical protein